MLWIEQAPHSAFERVHSHKLVCSHASFWCLHSFSCKQGYVRVFVCMRVFTRPGLLRSSWQVQSSSWGQCFWQSARNLHCANILEKRYLWVLSEVELSAVGAVCAEVPGRREMASPHGVIMSDKTFRADHERRREGWGVRGLGGSAGLPSDPSSWKNAQEDHVSQYARWLSTCQDNRLRDALWVTEDKCGTFTGAFWVTPLTYSNQYHPQEINSNVYINFIVRHGKFLLRTP